MSDVRLVEMMDEEGFVAATPCKIEGLLASVAWGTILEFVNDVEGAREAEGVIKE
jgi:hypothetical protein